MQMKRISFYHRIIAGICAMAMLLVMLPVGLFPAFADDNNAGGVSLAGLVSNALGYEYPDEYQYNGTVRFNNDTVTTSYSGETVTDDPTVIMNDMARFLGALYRANNDAVTALVYGEAEYVWDTEGTLKGSNWVTNDEAKTTLVSRIVADTAAGTSVQVIVKAGEQSFALTLAYAVEEAVPEKPAIDMAGAVNDALGYTYTPAYTYHGTITPTFGDGSAALRVVFPGDTADQDIVNDLARFLGALYRANEAKAAPVAAITYNGTVYSWDGNGTLKGSNWKNGENTLISAVAAGVSVGETVTLVVNEGIENQSFQLSLSAVCEYTILQQVEKAPGYRYEDNYQYSYTTASLDAEKGVMVVKYPEGTELKTVMNDFARTMGALARMKRSSIQTITYNNVTYTWDGDGTLKGSNWKNGESTLVSAVVAAFGSAQVHSGTVPLTITDKNNASITVAYNFSVAFTAEPVESANAMTAEDRTVSANAKKVTFTQKNDAASARMTVVFTDSEEGDSNFAKLLDNPTLNVTTKTIELSAEITEAAVAAELNVQLMDADNNELHGDFGTARITTKIGAGLEIDHILHDGSPVSSNDYTYDKTSGMLTITTSSFSTFLVYATPASGAKENAVITAEAAAKISYGDAAEHTISFTVNVDGTWSFTGNGAAVTADPTARTQEVKLLTDGKDIGIYDVNYTFTPANGDSFNAVSGVEQFEIIRSDVYLQVDSTKVTSHEYDGTTDVAASFSGSGALVLTVDQAGTNPASDDVSVVTSGMTATATAAAVGDAVGVAIAGVTLNSGNYTLKMGDTVAAATVKIEPKPLNVTVTGTVVKISDGDNKVKQGNVSVAAEITAGQIVGADAVTAAMKAWSELTEEQKDTLTFESIYPASSIAVSGFTNTALYKLIGGSAANYTVGTVTVGGAGLTGTITVADGGSLDLTATDATDFALADGAMITFPARHEADGRYWYAPDDLQSGSEYVLTLSDGSAWYTDASTTSTALGVGESSGTTATVLTDKLIIKNGKVYKVSVTYLFDKTAPIAGITAVENTTSGTNAGDEIDFSKDKLTYTISLSDSGAGVDLSSVKYAVAAAKPSLDAADWQTATVSDGKFDATIEASGILYIMVKDKLGNATITDGLRSLVIEDNAPTVAFDAAVDAQAGKSYKEHQVKVTAADEAAPSSGIYQVEYALYKNGETTAVSSDVLTFDNSVGIVSGVFTNTAPTALSDVANKTTVERTVTITSGDTDATKLDGIYKLEVKVTDYCGNTAAQCFENLVFDTSAPSAVAALDKATTAAEVSGDYYFGGDADVHRGDLTVTFSDTNLKDGAAYIVTLTDSDSGKVEKVGTATDAVPTVTITKSEIEGLAEGNLTLTFSVSDNAGNVTTTFESLTNLKETFDGNSKISSGAFVKDTIAPTVTMAMEGDEEHCYNSIYYYRKDNAAIQLTFTDAHLADKVTYVFKLNGADTSAKAEAYTAVTGAIVTAAEVGELDDGAKTATIKVTDWAGNSTNTFTDSSSGVALNTGGASASFVLDKTAPVLTITYTDPGAAHIYGATSYYKSSFTAEVAVTETNYDSSKISLYPSNAVPGSVTDESEKVTADYSDAAEHPSSTKTWTKTISSDDGAYNVKIVGEDKAGNILLVTEKIGETAVQSEVAASAEAAFTTYNKVLDTVAPVLTISYKDPGETHIYDKVTYYNADADIEAEVAVHDTNLEKDWINLYMAGVATPVAETEKITPDYTGSDLKHPTLNSNGIEDAAMTISASEEMAYQVKISGKDKAGNILLVTEKIGETAVQADVEASAEAAFTTYTKVLDKTAPVFTSVYTDTTAEVVGTKAYFGRNIEEVKATFTVSETNLDKTKFAAGVTSKVNDGTAASEIYNYDNATPDWAEVETEKGEATDEPVRENIYEAALPGDGVYRFQIVGEDKAGNKLVKDTAEEAKDDYMSTPKHDEGEFWSCYKIRDTKAPVVTVSMKDSEADFYRAILQWDGSGKNVYSPSLNQPYRKTTKATVTIAPEDCSPVNTEFAIASSVEGKAVSASEETYTYPDADYTKTVTIDGAQIFNITKLIVKDRAGNASVLSEALGEMGEKGTNSIYLDEKAPVEDSLAPTVKVATQTGKGRSTSGVALYDDKVTITAEVSDYTAGKDSSGLYQIRYMVMVGGVDQTAGVVVEAGDAATVGVGKIGYAPFKLGERAEGSNYGVKDFVSNPAVVNTDTITFTIPANKTYNDNNIELWVWAEDNSGNVLQKSDAPNQYYQFGIDLTAPTITVSYNNDDARNEKYFKEDRIAEVVVKERNFDSENTKITTEAAAVISDWKYAAGKEANGDEDTWTATVTYAEDGDYTFDVTTKDLVGHECDSEKVDYGESVAPREFTIDKTSPKIEVTFDNNSYLHEKYYKESRTATISIEEHNFDTADVKVEINASKKDGTVSAPSVSAFESAGDINAATVPFTEDGDFSMSIEFMDMAGNEAESVEVKEFTVDQTAPTLEISGVEAYMAYNGNVAPQITYYDTNYDNTSAGVSITGYNHKEGSNLNGVHSDDEFGGSFICDNIEVIRENDDIYTATGSVMDLAGNVTEETIVFSVNRFGSTYMITGETKELVENYYTNQPHTLTVTEINVNSLSSYEVTSTLNGKATKLNEGTEYTVTSSQPGWMQYDYRINSDNFVEQGAYSVTLVSVDEAENRNSSAAIKENDDVISTLELKFVMDTTPPSIIITGVEDGGRYKEVSRNVGIHYDDNTFITNLKIYAQEVLAAEYDAEQLRDMGEMTQYVATASNSMQQIRVEAVDAAGNRIMVNSGEFLLTDNFFIQYINNPVLLAATGGVLLVIFALLFILFRRRKEEEEE